MILLLKIIYEELIKVVLFYRGWVQEFMQHILIRDNARVKE